MKITNNVKKLRQAAGMTQADLAARLGITTPSITKWEKGRSNPDLDVYKRQVQTGLAESRNILIAGVFSVLAGIVLLLDCKNHRLEVDGEQLRYTSMFGPVSYTHLILMVSVPAPRILAPMELRKLARSTMWGSLAAFSMTVLPSAMTAAIIMFMVAPTDTTSR